MVAMEGDGCYGNIYVVVVVSVAMVAYGCYGNLPERQLSPLSVTGVSQRFNTCSLCRCSDICCKPISPN